MNQNEQFIAEMEAEAKNTRKMLERVPVDKLTWQPHEKSMMLGRLASHVAELPSWITMTINTDEFDLAKMDYKPLQYTTNEELLAHFEQNQAAAIHALQTSTEEDLMKPWTLRRGDHVMMTMPKAAVIRNWALSHQVHHRGQLSVYLRMLDIPVPGMYGPSKDDTLAMQAAMAQQN